MAAPTITPQGVFNDSGSRMDGTVWNAAWQLAFEAAINAALAALQVAGAVATCRVGNASGTQSIPVSTPTAITFATEAFDASGLHSTSVNTSRLTAAVAGSYHVTGGLFWTAQAPNSVTLLLARLTKNGTPIPGSKSYYPPIALLSTRGQGQPTAAIINLAAGDYVELEAYHEGTGGALTVDLAECALALVYLGA